MFDARSILKKTTKQDMLLFSFEKLDSEMQESWPLFRSVLMTACSRRSNARKQDLYWQAAVCTTGSVCLKNRSQRMTALQLYISLIVNNSSYTVSWHLNVVSRVFIKYVTSHNRITFYIFISVFCFIEIWFDDLILILYILHVNVLWCKRKYIFLYLIFIRH